MVVPRTDRVTVQGLISTPVTGTFLLFTVTLQVAVFPPSSVVTVTVASPALRAVTFPLSSTDAMSVLSDFHVTFLLVALSGLTVAVRFAFSPSVSSREVLSSVTSLTVTVFFATLTLQVAVFPPSSVVTVMVASPALRAVTFPLSSTDAMPVLSDFHVTFLLVALSGLTVAVRFSEEPSVRVNSVLSSDTSVTLTVFSLTVTAHFPDLPSAVAVMVAVPAFRPCTLPLPSTVAMALSEDVQVIVLSEAAAGEILAVNFVDAPSAISTLSGDTVTDEILTGSSSFLPHEVTSRTAKADAARNVSVCLNFMSI